MDQDSTNLDFSLSQRAYLHEVVEAEGGASIHSAPGIAAFICLNPGCEVSFPTAELLEAHAIIHAKGKQTPNTIDNLSVAAGDLSAHRLHHRFGHCPPTSCNTLTSSLSSTFYVAPTGFCDCYHGWPNAFNPVGISGYDYTDRVANMPSNTFHGLNAGTFTQRLDPSGFSSHGPYPYGHNQPTTVAPPSTHAVAQTSNVANATGSAQQGVVCAKCGTHVKRQSDLGRHMKKHQSDAQVFRCQIQGCQYSSKRKDKVMEHSRRPH